MSKKTAVWDHVKNGFCQVPGCPKPELKSKKSCPKIRNTSEEERQAMSISEQLKKFFNVMRNQQKKSTAFWKNSKEDYPEKPCCENNDYNEVGFQHRTKPDFSVYESGARHSSWQLSGSITHFFQSHWHRDLRRFLQQIVDLEFMDLILFHPVEYNRLYNCSFYNVDQIPLGKRQNLVIGWTFIALFFVFEILYIPCIFAIGKNLSNASFKFMFYIGIVDIIVLWVAGLVSGYLAVTGAVFCSHPTLIYASGIIALLFWTAETTASMVLALNRFILVCSPTLSRTLYGGKMAWLWLVPTLMSFCLICMWEEPDLAIQPLVRGE
ncbi:serpentine type 7TM GPCR chemoreceptor srt domain-containing protein [Ditylenchus destructor]|uniref:Serpentine type 7TM GPCR chemoreceptor srt domain-containing protein n=1 Tax=Ditylenchus destructor TaxID=166010 RepID=A0AAD4MRU5_9BILA|nr:serpentine type 7TM GPCR chemoreceptor srt domain-containing protein [Ditylenchus destructor]